MFAIRRSRRVASLHNLSRISGINAQANWWAGFSTEAVKRQNVVTESKISTLETDAIATLAAKTPGIEQSQSTSDFKIDLFPNKLESSSSVKKSAEADEAPEDYGISRVPLAVDAYYLEPLRHKAPYGIPVCDLQLRSFSARNLEFFCDFAIRAAYYLKLPAFGPIPLPKRTERWTVPRSNFVHKKAQENWERVTLRRLIQIKDASPEAVEVWLAFLRQHEYYGIGMKANVWGYDEIGVGKRMNITLETLKDTTARPKWAHFGRGKDTSMGEAVQRIMKSPQFQALEKEGAKKTSLNAMSINQVTAKSSDENVPEGANDGSPLHPVPTEDAVENSKDEQPSGKNDGTPEEAIPREMEEGQQEDKSIPDEHHPDNVMKSSGANDGTATHPIPEPSEQPEKSDHPEEAIPREMEEGQQEDKSIPDEHHPDNVMKSSGANDGTNTHPMPVEETSETTEKTDHPEEAIPRELEEGQQEDKLIPEEHHPDNVMKSSPNAPESTSSEAIDEHENSAPRELEEGQEEAKDHKIDEVHEEALEKTGNKEGAKTAPTGPESTSEDATNDHGNAAPRELEEGQEEAKDHKIDEVHEEALKKTGNEEGKKAAPAQPESTSSEVNEEHGNAAPRELEEGQEEGKDHKMDEVHEEALKEVENKEGKKAAPAQPESTSTEVTEEHDNAAPRELEEGQEEGKDHKIDEVHEEALKEVENKEGQKSAAGSSTPESTSSEATEEHDNAAPRELEEGQEEAKDHKIDEVHEEALNKTGNKEGMSTAPEPNTPESTSSEVIDEHENSAPRELEEGQEEGKDFKIDEVHEEALKEVENKEESKAASANTTTKSSSGLNAGTIVQSVAEVAQTAASTVNAAVEEVVDGLDDILDSKEKPEEQNKAKNEKK